MNAKYIKAKIDSMARTPGVAGCAVVEVAAGMVWHAASTQADFVAMAEAASDYWRLYLRMNMHFTAFGKLTHCTLTHETHQLMLTLCGHDMVFVTVCDKNYALNLSDWNFRIHQLRLILEAE